ncbi:STAS domain-containing protein [Fuscovulum ytuae]|uniref:STAS domain-containing protein n=1 Tax=Fuscovulum ytuae TaxID=3042299 RepID=UPI003B21BB9C
MTQTIPLPSRLDVEAAAALWTKILLSDGDLLLDAVDLHHLGAAGLQTLLMAQRHQESQGRSLSLVNIGPDIAAQLGNLGATQLIPVQATALPGGVE